MNEPTQDTPVKVEVIGQLVPGSVLQVDRDLDQEQVEVVIEALRAMAGHNQFVLVTGFDSATMMAPPPEGSDTRPMPVDEFRALGLLQEVNRRLLHPLGLKLGTTGDGRLDVWDDRGDPEGVRFEGFDLAAGAALFDALWEQRRPAREAALGFMVQPSSESFAEIADRIEAMDRPPYRRQSS